MNKIGLDVGSSSLGWALREGNKIEKYGVVTFDAGMTKGTNGYSSPTKERREARGKRNLIRARKYRKWALLKLLLVDFVPLRLDELDTWSKYRKGQPRMFPENKNFLKWLACDFTYLGKGKYQNPYELRVAALEGAVSKHEFGRALYHIIQRRGYKDIGEATEETQKQIQKRGECGFQQALEKNGTIAKALTEEFLNKGKRARNQYPYRDEYEQELTEMCRTQACEEALTQKLKKAILWQRPLNTQRGNVGKCTLEVSKPRCPVSHPIFEMFRAWQFINTIKYFDDTEEKRDIPQDYRDLLFWKLFLKKDKNFKFEEIRNFLDKQFGAKRKYNYPQRSNGVYDTTVSGMPVCKGLINVFGANIVKSIETLEQFHMGNAPKVHGGYSVYDLWHIFFESNEHHIQQIAAQKFALDNGADVMKTAKGITKLKQSMAKGYADLSLKALCKILPFLKNGYLYNDAVLLAKMPELLGDRWPASKGDILDGLKTAREAYYREKTVVEIANNLIDAYKGLPNEEIFAYKDFEYSLDSSDKGEVENACIRYFGEKSWERRTDKQFLLNDVEAQYQRFFHDHKRGYRKTPSLAGIFMSQLQKRGIEITGDLYHHSKTENKYGNTVRDKKTGFEILPEPRIDSIKNPMFNKAMNILRKLLNELIKSGMVDEDTEVVVELARELNDNNKRVAIERFQGVREANREKYREFLNEFKIKENGAINVEKSIAKFELWTEQIFDEFDDGTGTNINKNTAILKEKEAARRYELWREQQGRCMYTGKHISLSQLFSNETDIEHTIPRSKLPDNTMANQTICFAWYNRDIKKNALPSHCKNFFEPQEGIGQAILPGLGKWMELRDSWKDRYERKLKPAGNEDEIQKNKRIQEKHFCKMHYDYWHDKIERFTAEEVKEGWARRQLVDTQMIGKYAREFLRTYFKKVSIQKGSVTADFRKIYGFQEVDEIKSRNKHTHHAIDAAVLTLIPVNSSQRDKILEKMYKTAEIRRQQYTNCPFDGFDAQKLIQEIESTTLVINQAPDKMRKETYKNVRKRGRIQYLKDKDGNYTLNPNGEKIVLKAKGDTVRSTMFAATYLGKIKDVERNENEKPVRENGDWKYKRGADEFIFVKRENIDKVKASEKLIQAIIDPAIRQMVAEQKNNVTVEDYQGNTIRHVRIRTSVGREVKTRVNYLSKHDYKNMFYSVAGSIPFAILFQKPDNGVIQRQMIPIPSCELAKMGTKTKHFDIEQYVSEYHPSCKHFPQKQLIKVGQKVLVLKNDGEYEARNNKKFQSNRLYVISQLSEGSIWLKFHLEAQSLEEIKKSVKAKKDIILRKYEDQLGIPEVVENMSIADNTARKKDYENRRYGLNTINKSFRLKTLCEQIGLSRTKEILEELKKFKAIPGALETDGETPLLKTSVENWNFLYEGYDFTVSMLGKLEWLRDD